MLGRRASSFSSFSTIRSLIAVRVSNLIKQFNCYPHRFVQTKRPLQMANSRFEYVRDYECSTEHVLLPDTYIVIRLDGKQFHRFSKQHNYLKPNDKRALDLMNAAAEHVMREYFPEIILAYGQSDEFSFVLHPYTRLFNRRQNKLTSVLTSAFTSAFVFYWARHFGQHAWTEAQPLHYPPVFDGRCVLYPTRAELLDYLKWRAVDCHINNVYNTTFYALTQQYVAWQPIQETDAQVQTNTKSLVNIDSSTASSASTSHSNVERPPLSNTVRLQPQPITYRNAALSPNQAELRLQRSVSRQKKNDILQAEYSIDYDHEPAQFRQGSLIAIDRNHLPSLNGNKSSRSKRTLTDSDRNNFKQQVRFITIHDDLILDHFWNENSHLIDPIQLT